MKQQLSLLTLGVALGVLCGASGTVQAEEGILLRGESDAFEAQPADTWWRDGVVDEQALADHRGGSDLELNEIRAVGTVSEVAASDLVTGHNVITEGALSGATGVPMIIQNSGNGVLIQNAVILNVDVH